MKLCPFWTIPPCGRCRVEQFFPIAPSDWWAWLDRALSLGRAEAFRRYA